MELICSITWTREGSISRSSCLWGLSFIWVRCPSILFRREQSRWFSLGRKLVARLIWSSPPRDCSSKSISMPTTSWQQGNNSAGKSFVFLCLISPESQTENRLYPAPFCSDPLTRSCSAPAGAHKSWYVDNISWRRKNLLGQSQLWEPLSRFPREQGNERKQGEPPQGHRGQKELFLIGNSLFSNLVS